MPVCRNCSNRFPARIAIDGRKRHLGNRKYCLDCSPFGAHNTRKLENFVYGSAGSWVPTKQQACICNLCGREYTYHRKGGATLSRCNSCRNKVRMHIRKIKAVDYLGGACSRCGYDKCRAALDFHHLDPDNKKFSLGGNYNRKWEEFKKELDKCVLLCANCHREEHADLDDKYERLAQVVSASVLHTEGSRFKSEVAHQL